MGQYRTRLGSCLICSARAHVEYTRNKYARTTLPYKHFVCFKESASQRHGGGMVEAKVDAELLKVALQWASGGNKGAWHRGGLPPIVTQWH